MLINCTSINTLLLYYYSNIYTPISGLSAALSQLGWWGGIFLLGEVGPVLLSSPLKTSGTFYFLSGMCLLAFLHVLVLIPETKARMFLICFYIQLNLMLLYFVQGHSLESIDDLFSKPWSKRANIFYYLKYIAKYSS